MKYSKELTEEICKKIENGTLNKDAAALCDVSEETFYAWQRKDDIAYRPEFAESIKKAVAKRKDNFVKTIVTASMKQWTAAAWYLERIHNDEFGKIDRNILSGDEDAPIKIDIKKTLDKIYGSSSEVPTDSQE